MNEDFRFQTAICSDYEKLLIECQRALYRWKERREELARFGPQGKRTGDELQRLQADYARAYNRLERHSKSCGVCRFTAELSKAGKESPVCITTGKQYPD